VYKRQTITHTGHGRTTGELVNVRNANADNFSGTITVVNVNTFTVSTTNSGSASGSAAAYSLGFTTTSVSPAGATISAPSGGDVQLLSYYHSTGARSGAAYILTLPSSATNGAGANSAVYNSFFPIVATHNLVTGAAVNRTFSLATSSPFNVITLGNLSAADSCGIRADF
jgi:hypothetical protein